MDFIIKLLKQPSTYRGLTILAGIMGYSISPELADKIGIAVVAVLGAIEVFRDEHKQPEAPNANRIEPQKIATPEVGAATGIDGQ